MIIDELLPEWDVEAEHRIRINASAEVVYEAFRSLDMGRSWGVRLLFALRGLPRDALTLDGLRRLRFALLADEPPREMVLGIIGRFWTLTGHLQKTDAEHFRRFAEPGYAKAVWHFLITEASGDGVILSTNTRVLCLDEASR